MNLLAGSGSAAANPINAAAAASSAEPETLESVVAAAKIGPDPTPPAPTPAPEASAPTPPTPEPPVNGPDEDPSEGSRWKALITAPALLLLAILLMGTGLYMHFSDVAKKQAADNRATYQQVADQRAADKASSDINILRVRNLTATTAKFQDIQVTGTATINNLLAQTAQINQLDATDTATQTLVVRGATTSGSTDTGSLNVSGNTTLAGLTSSGQVRLTGNSGDVLIIQAQQAGQALVSLRNASGTEVTSLDSSGNLNLGGNANVAGTLIVPTAIVGDLTANTATIGTLIAGGQGVFTAIPSGSGVNQGTVYINPASANAGDTLLGLAVAGAEKLRVDSNGNFANAGNLGTAGNLTVAGTSSLTGQLNVAGPTVLGSTLQAASTISAVGDINTNGMYTVNGAQISSANLSNDANLAKLNGTQTFTGANTFTAPALFQNASNSSTAFRVLDAGGGSLINANTTATTVGVGGATSVYTLKVTNTTTGKLAALGVNNADPNQLADVVNFQTNGVNNLTINYGGRTTIRNTTNSTSGFSVVNAAAGSVFNLDTVNSALTANTSATFKNQADSTTAFQIQNAAGAKLFNVDTLNSTVAIGNGNIPSLMSLPGVAGSYANTPDSATTSITGDIDIRVRLAMNDWTPATNGMIMTKWATSGQSAYRLYMATTGRMIFTYSPDGTTPIALTSSSQTGFVDGTAHWVRVTRSAATGEVIFYTASDLTSVPSSWTQLGSIQTGATGSMFDSTADVEVGAAIGGAFSPLAANVYQALIYNGINGTAVANFDPTRAASLSDTTFTATTGEVWTRNGSAAFLGSNSISVVNSLTSLYGPVMVQTLSGTAGSVAVCRNADNQLATCTVNPDGVTLQQAYNASAGGATPEILLDATRGGLTIADAASPIGAALLSVTNNAGDFNYFSTSAAGTNITGPLTLGRIAGSGTVTPGSLLFADGTTDNFGLTLNTTTLTANRTITLPNESGTVCTTGSVCTGYAPSSGGTGYIKNGTSVQTNANFNIQSAAAGSVVGALKSAVSQTADLLQFQDSNGSPLTRVLANGSININRVDTGVIDANAPLAIQAVASYAGQIIRAQSGQSADLFQLQNSSGNTITAFSATGALQFSDGSGGIADTNLYRSAADTLKTDDTLVINAPISAFDYTKSLVIGAREFTVSSSGSQADAVFATWNTTNDRWEASATSALIGPTLFEYGYGGTYKIRAAGVANRTAGDALTFTDAFTVQPTGNIELGAAGGKTTLQLTSAAADTGITIGGDTNLYRSAANTLKTDDALIVGGTSGTNSTTAFQVQDASGNSVLSVDTTNDRVGIGTTTPDAALTIKGPNTSDQLSIGISSSTAYLRLGADNGSNGYIAGNATHNNGVWNYVNTGAYGGCASRIQLTGVFTVSGSCGGTNPITWTTALQANASGQVSVGGGSPANGVLTVGTNTTTAAGGLYFGTDTNLYRSAVGTLKTDGALTVGASLNILAGNAAYFQNAAANSAAYLYNSGGSGQAFLSTNATRLYASGMILLGGYSGSIASTTGLGVLGNSEFQGALTVDGTQYFGTAQDTNLYRSAANVLATDDAFRVGGTTGTNSTTAFSVQNASGAPVLNVDTTNSKLTVQGSQSTAILGSELANQNFTAWTNTGWTATSTQATHNTGNTTALSTNVSVTSGQTYEVDFTVSGMTTGSVTPTLGAVNIPQYGTTNNYPANDTYRRTVVAGATGSVALAFTPTTDFNGTISAVSVKLVTLNSVLPVLALNNSDGSIGLEVRSGGNNLANTFIGANSGSTNTTGYNNTALGVNTLLNNTTGNNNTAVGTYVLQSNITGAANTGIGYAALQNNTTGVQNAALGYAALQNNTTGYNNAAVGVGALQNNTTGNNNTALGTYALQSNTTGSSNAALGYAALQSNTTGIQNTALGTNALYSNTTGSYNTALGAGALQSNTTGIYNTALGVSALQSNTTGIYNTALGAYALYNNTTGSSNAALGYAALQSNTTGIQNTALGTNALYSNTTGSFNTALGSSALQNNTTGSSNAALGVSALQSNTTGIQNTALGTNALNSNTTGDNNAAVGVNALLSNTTGYSNAALGTNALQNNTTGSSNTAVGTGALQNNTTGNNNTALGTNALLSNTTGIYNAAFGAGALQNNTTGTYNTAVGLTALYNNTTGDYNISLGINSLSSNTTGYSNTALGTGALQSNTTGYSNTALGTGADVLYTGQSNSTSIGSGAKVGSSNTVVLGSSAWNGGAATSTVIGASYANGSSLLSVGSGTYNTGTIAQTGTAITGTGTTWTAGMTGGTIYYSDGTSGTFTYLTATTGTSSLSKTVTAGASYTIVWGGLNVSSTATALLQNTIDSTTAFSLQRSNGVALLTADTANAKVIVGDGSSGTLQIGDGSITKAPAANFNFDSGGEFKQDLIVAATSGGVNQVKLGNIGGNAGLALGSALDTNLYRGAAGILKTDTYLYAGQDISARNGTAYQVSIGYTGIGQASIAFGSAGDAALYRSGTGTLTVAALGSNPTSFVVKGTASQATTDLFQAQDSTGAILSKIDYQGNLTVKAATINGDLTVNGHIITGDAAVSGATPNTSNAGAGATCVITGNQTSGTITLTSGTSTLLAGTQCTATISYTSSPRPVVSGANAVSAALAPFISASTSTLTFGFGVAPAPSTVYTFNYFNAQ